MSETVRDFRRAQIIAAARTLVAEAGLDALTFVTLEEKLGFSRGVITYHFKNKDEIVDAVLASAIAEIDAATHAEVMASATFEDQVRAVLRTKVRGFLGHAEAGRIMISFWGRIGSDPHIRRINAKLYATYREQGVWLVELGKAAGAFAADVPAKEMAALLVGTVLGIVLQASFEPGAVDADAAVEEAATALLARLKVRSGSSSRKRAGY